MKASIQPKYYQATVTCNCGNTFVTGSTKPEIHVEVCSKCHSFYTGTQKTAAAKGRVTTKDKAEYTLPCFLIYGRILCILTVYARKEDEV